MDNLENVLTKEELQAAVRELFKRSQTDGEFRELCLRDPVAAIREISGKSLPEGFTLEFKDADNRDTDKGSF